MGASRKSCGATWSACVLVGLVATGCGNLKSVENQLLAPSNTTMEGPRYFASDEYLRMGKVHFRNGDYGIAEKNFRKAVESTPKDVEAWLGLAASYDRLQRFDLADKAYSQVLRLNGKHPVVWNNIGYSYLLRGDLKRARRYILRAYEVDPDNEFVKNNVALLSRSDKFVKRSVN